MAKLISNVDRVTNNIRKDFRELDSELAKTVSSAAEYGSAYMFNIAPWKTGKTARAIKWSKGQKIKEAIIVIGDGHPERRGQIKSSRGTGGLTWFMNFGHDIDVWVSGEPRFIIKGQEAVRNRYNKRARQVINAFVN